MKNMLRYFDLKEIKSLLKKNKLKLIKVFNHINNKKDMNFGSTRITQKL